MLKLKIYFWLIIIICFTSKDGFAQTIIQGKANYNDKVVIFNLEKDRKEYRIQPIVIIKNNKLIQPPQMNWGNYSPEGSYFVFDYFQYGYSYLAAYSRSNQKAVVINEKINTNERDSTNLCTVTVSARVNLLNKKKILKLLTNSLYVAENNSYETSGSNLEKKLLLNVFKIYYQQKNGINPLEIFKLSSVSAISYSEKDFICKFTIDQKGMKLSKNIISIFEKIGNNYVINFYKELYQYNESGGDWSNESMDYIGAIDVDNDNIPELIFYYSSGESFGYNILKKYYNGWQNLYSTGDGCG